jgi:hypothetical protein
MARRRVPEGRFIVGSYLEADLPHCVAVTALGEVFNYLFDGRNGMTALAKLFRRVHATLVPGGLFVFDVSQPGRGKGPRVKHFAGEGWEIVFEIDEDEPKRRLERKITTFRRVGRLYRRSEEVHVLRLYAASEVLGALRNAGFRARALRGYGDLRFRKAYVGFLARKPPR